MAKAWRWVSLGEEVEDSSDFWTGLVHSYNSPVEHRLLIGLDRSTNGPLPDCDCKYTLLTDQLFNLEFQVKSVFDL